MKKFSLFVILLLSISMVSCGSTSASTASNKTVDSSDEASGFVQTKSSSIKAAADAVHLTLAHADTEKNSLFGPTMTKFANKVAELTNGEVIVDVYPNGQLGTHAEEVSGIQDGSIDFAPIASTFVANFCPDVSVFDMPFLFDDIDQVWATMDGDVGEKINNELKQNNIEPLVWWGLGFRYVTTSEKKPINNLADMKGFRIRIMQSPIYQAMFESLGADPVPMDFSELYTALQQGTVDGQENPYSQILSSNLWEVNPIIVKTEHAFSPTVLMMSPQVANKVTPDQLKLIKEAAEECKDDFRQSTIDINNNALETLINEKGCTLVDSIDKKEFQDAVAPVYDEFPQYKDMVNQIRTLGK
jgi:tripartite ATP-independent transporter DctP family solute receptor